LEDFFRLVHCKVFQGLRCTRSHNGQTQRKKDKHILGRDSLKLGKEYKKILEKILLPSSVSKKSVLEMKAEISFEPLLSIYQMTRGSLQESSNFRNLNLV